MARGALNQANQKVPTQNTNETSINFLVLVAAALCAGTHFPNWFTQSLINHAHSDQLPQSRQSHSPLPRLSCSTGNLSDKLRWLRDTNLSTPLSTRQIALKAIPFRLKKPTSRRKGTPIQRRLHWLDSFRHSHALHNCIQERPQPTNQSKHRTTNMITIIGPRDTKVPRAVNTTSHSNADWSRGLSPFALGPIALYASHTARLFENAWQFAKLYPEHADANGQPTNRYWTWAQNGWRSTTAFRYPLGKGRKPLCSLWNGRRLDYIAARQQIYIPLYQNAVKQTNAYKRLERLYLAHGHITLFDFDGYDHRKLGMSFKDVINCPTRICGHAFVLAIMLTYGSNFTIDTLPAVDQADEVIRNSTQQALCYPIKIVNRKTYKGHSEYIGRTMPGLAGSPLANQYKIQPHGAYTREESVSLYRRWLWQEIKKRQGPAYLELLRLIALAKNQDLVLSCWCDPELCHGTPIKNAIAFLIKTTP